MFLFQERHDALTEHLAIQSAHTIKRGCIVSASVIPHLNPAILESIELPLNEASIALLQAGCPNLRSLSMYVALNEDQRKRIMLLIAALPKLEHLELSVGPIERISEALRALGGKLKTLRLDKLGLPHLLSTLGLEITTLDAAAAEQLVWQHLFVPLSGLYIDGNVFLGFLIEKIDWEKYTTHGMMDGALQSLLDCLGTHIAYLTRERCANHILSALQHFLGCVGSSTDADTISPQVMPWICEQFLAAVPVFQGDPYVDSKRLATTFVYIFYQLDGKHPVRAVLEPLAPRLIDALRSLAEADAQLPKILFQTVLPPSHSLVKVLLSDNGILARAGLTENSICANSLPLFSRCHLLAARLFFESPTFDPFIEVNSEPFALRWMINLLWIPLDPESLLELSKIASILAERYKERAGFEHKISKFFLSLGSSIWERDYRQCAPLFKLVPRPELVQLIRFDNINISALPRLLDFLDFIFKDTLGEPDTAVSYRNSLTQQLWIFVLKSDPNVLQGMRFIVDMLLQHLPIPVEIVSLHEHPDTSELASQVNKDTLAIIRDRLNEYAVQQHSKGDVPV